MAKYAFNTDADKMSDVVGIDENRWDELNTASSETAFAAFLTDKKISNNGLALELLINKAQPTTIVEAMCLGYMYGRSSEKMQELVGKLQKAMI